jgi:hypothetical protein
MKTESYYPAVGRDYGESRDFFFKNRIQSFKWEEEREISLQGDKKQVTRIVVVYVQWKEEKNPEVNLLAIRRRSWRCVNDEEKEAKDSIVLQNLSGCLEV